MGFFDLSIPHRESDRHITAADKANLKTHRLKLTVKAAELGYTGVAYNRVIKGVMSDADRCSISLFPLSSLLKLAPSLSSSVKFHRDLLNIGVSTPFRQYTRLTVVIDSSAQAAVLNSGNPVLKSYDIVAVRPMNQNAFEQACQTSEVDVISIDFSEKLPFRLKQPIVKAAIERGVYFEIMYCSLIKDAQVKRQMISNAKLLVDWTRGKNLIVSSAALSVSELRGPYDVANLLSLLGLSLERAKAAASKNCRSLIANSMKKKQYYKGAIKVEVMPSSERVNSEESAFVDWLKWDPISSGEGDLQLDDIEKSFSASGSVSNTMKTMEFVSALNSLPSHGLQIEDVIPLAKSAPEPPDIGHNLSGTEKTEVAVAVNGMSEEPVGKGDLHLADIEKSLSASDISNTMKTVDLASALNNLPSRGLQIEDIKPLSKSAPEPPDSGKNLSGTEKTLGAVFMNGISHESGVLNLFPDDHQTFVLTRRQDSGHEDSTTVLLHNGPVNVEENSNLIVTHENLRGSEALGVCFSPFQAGLWSLQSQSCLAGCDDRVHLPPGANLHKCAKDTEIAHNSDGFGCVRISSNSKDTITTEESKTSVSFVVGLQAEIVAAQDNMTKIDCQSGKELSFPLVDVTVNEEFMESEKFLEKKENIVAFADEFLFEKSHDTIKEENQRLVAESEPLQEDGLDEQNQSMHDVPQSYQIRGESLSGRGRVKRRTSYQPILFPFKHLLNSRPSRKKIRKLNPM